MNSPPVLTYCRRRAAAFVLLAVAACGGGARSTSPDSGSGSAVSSGAGTASGTVTAGTAGGSGGNAGSAGVASGASAGAGGAGASGMGSDAGSGTASGSDSQDAGGDGGVTAAQSCARGGPGMTNCGPGGQGTESCCTSLGVTGGTYYRTYGSDADGGATGLGDPATVSSFRLDKYLVTVGRFRQFVNAVLPPGGGAGWLPVAGSGKHSHLNGGNGLNATGAGYEPGWVAMDDSNVGPSNTNLACSVAYGTWTNTAGSNESLPMTCVNWYEAYAFCIWDGAFLPSDAEWAYAAAGGNEQRQHPWGSTDPGTNNQYAIYGCFYPNGAGDAGVGNCTGVANIASVGTASLGAGPWGQVDLVGDVFEWDLDWAGSYTACSDCADVVADSGRLPSTQRVFRGGDYVSAAYVLGPSTRGGAPPKDRLNGFGFRCARTP
jgi:sulfatase modifying factor 1